MKTRIITLLAVLVGLATYGLPAMAAEHSGDMTVYDEAAYTEFVENKMKELDALYLQFCDTCGVDSENAAAARMEFLTGVRELMTHMNARFDKLDPKAGAALSGTETLVSIHALTMLVDILTATQLEHMTAHPYIE